MANSLELERLIVRLQGDGAQLQQTLEEAESKIQELEKTVKSLEKTIKKFEKQGESIKKALPPEFVQEMLTGLDKGIANARKNFQTTGQKIVGTINSIGEAATKAGMKLTAMVSIPIGTAGGFGLKLAADAEQVAVSMEVLTGSTEVATRLIRELRTMGAKTPFEFTDLSQATQTLLAFGRTQEIVLEDLDMLSNVASGDANKLQALAVVFGQIAANEKLMGQDLLQLINVGFNPLQEIAKKTGETMGELRKRMEQGKISFDEVRQAFVAATSAGGRFFEMNEKQSQTLKGLWSTVSDVVTQALTSVGEQIEKTFGIKDVLKQATPFIEGLAKSFEQLDPATKKWIIGLTAAAVAAGPVLLIGGKLITMTVLLSKKVIFLAVYLKDLAQAAAGITAGIGGGSLALGLYRVAAAGAAVAGIAILTKKTYEASDAVQDLNKSLEKGIELNEKIAKGQTRRSNKVLAEGGNIRDPNQRRAFFANALQIAEREAAGLQNQIKGAEKNVDRLSTTFKRATGNEVLAGAKRELEEVKENAKRAESRVEALREAFKEADSAAKKAQDAQKAQVGIDREKAAKEAAKQEKQRAQAVRQVVDELQRAADTYGLTERQVLQYELAQKKATETEARAALARFDWLEMLKRATESHSRTILEMELNRRNATEAQRAAAIAQFEQAESLRKAELERQKQLENDQSITKTIQSLKDQAVALSMTERQLLQYELAQKGASKAQINAALTRFDQVESLKNRRSIADTIRELREQAKTYGMTKRELLEYELAQKKATDAEKKAALAAFDQVDALEKAEQAQRNLMNSLRGVEATGRGVEAMARIAEFQNLRAREAKTPQTEQAKLQQKLNPFAAARNDKAFVEMVNKNQREIELAQLNRTNELLTKIADKEAVTIESTDLGG